MFHLLLKKFQLYLSNFTVIHRVFDKFFKVKINNPHETLPAISLFHQISRIQVKLRLSLKRNDNQKDQKIHSKYIYEELQCATINFSFDKKL